MDNFGHATATRGTRTAAAAVGGTLALFSLVVLVFTRTQLPTSPAFLSMYLALAGGTDALTAFLLLVQARVTRSMPIAILAGGYTYSACTIVVHALTFPGIFAPHGLLGAGTQTSIWLWVAWHGTAPLFVAGYALATRREAEMRARADDVAIAVVMIAPAIVVAAFAALVVPHGDALPPLVHEVTFTPVFGVIGTSVTLAVAGSLATLVYVTRLRRALDLWLAVSLTASLADAILTVTASGRYTMGWYAGRIDSLIAASVLLATFIASFDTMIRRLTELSSKDGLTGLVNRRAFDERLEEHVALAARSDSPLSLLMIDVDYFKQYNDRYGHPAGDAVLVKIANAIDRALKRKTDFAARFGGEEFVVVLPHTDAAGAKLLAGRINMAVNDWKLAHEGSPIGHVTISIGCDTSNIGAVADSAQKLVSHADEALYKAKENGRNRVEFAPPRTVLPVVPLAS